MVKVSQSGSNRCCRSSCRANLCKPFIMNDLQEKTASAPSNWIKLNQSGSNQSGQCPSAENLLTFGKICA
jgi:hypothetical protein